MSVTDLKDTLVTSSKPPGQPQRRPDDRTSNAGVVIQAVSGSRRAMSALAMQEYTTTLLLHPFNSLFFQDNLGTPVLKRAKQSGFN